MASRFIDRGRGAKSTSIARWIGPGGEVCACNRGNFIFEELMAQTSGTVTHDTHSQQFEMSVPGGKAVLGYRRGERTIDLLHTSVPPEDEGNGHGTSLVQAAFDYARESGLEVVPTCPFVKAYVEKHPEQRDIVATA